MGDHHGAILVVVLFAAVACAGTNQFSSVSWWGSSRPYNYRQVESSVDQSHQLGIPVSLFLLESLLLWVLLQVPVNWRCMRCVRSCFNFWSFAAVHSRPSAIVCYSWPRFKIPSCLGAKRDAWCFLDRFEIMEIVNRTITHPFPNISILTRRVNLIQSCKNETNFFPMM
jgi:hypothetical protein